MKDKMKRLFSVFLTAAMTFVMLTGITGTVLAGEKEDVKVLPEHPNGYIPIDKVFSSHVIVRDPGDDESEQEEEDDLPVSYRSDEQPWAVNIRVKNQDQSSLCWAFALTSSAEYSYAKELFEQTGEIFDSELSPGQLGQSFYNRIMDPLENTEGDFNDIPAGNQFVSYGGNQIFAMQHLATWSGLVRESDAPFDLIKQHLILRGGSYQWDFYKLPYSPDLQYGHNELIQEESILYFSPTQTIMKQMILKYGAISVSMEFDYRKFMNLDEIDPETGEKYPGGRSYYNDGKNISANHALTVIGWDDDYPKEYFSREVETEDGEKNTVMPEKNGAWVIQNSWGDKAHDHGIVYVSYESADFNCAVYDVYAFDMQPADTYDYNFQYDGNALSTDSSDRTDDGGRLPYWTKPNTSAANVFTNTTGHYIKLEAVGYTTFTYGLTEYDVSVYTGLSDPDDPTSGTFRGTSRINSTTCGCKTGKLDQPVLIKPGESFSIVFGFTDFTAFGIEASASNDYFIFAAQIDPGQSFFKSARAGSEWEDMYENEICFRIKGFASVADDEAPAENPFTDVKEEDYFFDSVLWALNHDPQITKGVSDTVFGPEETCTRGQIVTFLWRANGEPEPTVTENPFSDVKEDAYYLKAVLWATENKITSGTSETEFSPDNPCTRAQAATFLWRAEGCPEPAGTDNPFDDVSEDAYYLKAVLWAAKKGITKGVSENEFGSDETCTRGQIVTFLYRNK